MTGLNKKQADLRSYVSLAGGLGNQLFQLAAGLANSNGDEVILLSTLGNPNTNKVGQPVVTQLFSPEHIMPEGDLHFNFIQRKVNNFLLRTTRKHDGIKYFQLRWHIHCLVLKISSIVFRRFSEVIAPYDAGYEPIKDPQKSNRLLIGYFQSPKYWAINGPEHLRSVIKLDNDSIEVSTLRNLSKIERPLIVHIRAGDYLDFPDFGTLSPDYYRRAIHYQWKLGNYNSIWVFTNSPHTVSSYLPTDYLNYYKIIDVHNGSAAHNLEVMRFGYGYVISNSTYSWWGAYLSNNLNPVIVAPKVWFKNLPEPSNLIPDNWIRLEASHE